MSFDDFPRFSGSLSLDDVTRHSYAQDYGQIVHELPRAVLRPGSVDDVVEMVRFARSRGLPIAARGQGHQPFGQAQVQDGIVIDMRALGAVHGATSARLDLDAGATWRTAMQAALPGHTPPVLPNYLGLTVGGTLSIGGVGVASLRHGAQVDNVIELDVVTGEGELIRCSERREPELFEAVLAGQGQCGIITRAALRLVEAKPMLREYMLRYADLPTLLHDEAALLREDRADGAVALAGPSPDGWLYMLSLVRQFTPPATPDDAALCAGLRAIEGSLRTRDLDYATYMDTYPEFPFGQSQASLGLFIPGSAAAGFLGGVVGRLREDDLGGTSGMRIFFWDRSRFSRTLLRLPCEETLVYAALLRTDTSDPDTLARMLAGNRTLFEANRELGGTLYPFAALELTRDDWRRNYGSAWSALTRAKQRYDPSNVFASGPDLFRG